MLLPRLDRLVETQRITSFDRLVDTLCAVPRRAKIRPDEPGEGRIQQAALELFGERGYDATSTADIGRRAGISKSVLYHYFPSKADLYRAVCAQQTADLVEAVRDAVRKGGGARLRPGVEAYLSFLASRPAAWRLLVREQPAEPELVAVHRELEASRAEALAAALASPGKRQRNATQIGLVATAIRAFASWWYEHPDVPQEAIADSIVAFARAAAENMPDR
jgi:AcrR family transcriptional regulator